MSKKAVVTLSIGHPKNDCWMREGLPSKAAYAKRVGADFINITERKLGPPWSIPAEKYQIGDLLAEHDRVLYLDADLAIDPRVPDLFELVPEDHFAAYDEGRPALYAWLKQGWPDDPCEFYVNNGVFLCSREHRWLFDWQTLNRKLETYEQTCMSRRIWEALREKTRCPVCGGTGGEHSCGCDDPGCDEFTACWSCLNLDRRQIGPLGPSVSVRPKIKMRWLSQSWNYMPRLWVGDKAAPGRGWVEQAPPDPVWVWHYPCHKPDERAKLMRALNRRFGL